MDKIQMVEPWIRNLFQDEVTLNRPLKVLRAIKN